MSRLTQIEMEQVLLKSFLLMNESLSKTAVHNSVQQVYTVLASVCTTWRSVAKGRQSFAKTLIQHSDELGKLAIFDLLASDDKNGAKLCLSDLHNDDSRCRTAYIYVSLICKLVN